MISTEALYTLYLKHRKISTDTRKISQDSIFFALKGEHFNGNTFAAKALELGAAVAVVDEAEYCADDRFVLVEDVLSAMQNLARYHRSKLNIPVIGLTGSNGKTTTKELLNVVLSKKYKTLATQGNLNNHIGVPITVLSIEDGTELAIIEMGANHQKEIALLCEIAQPTHGLITNVGKAHLEGFGGFEGVKLGKGELYQWLAKSDGYTFIYRNNPLLMEMAEQYGGNIQYYGSEEDFVSGAILSAHPYLCFQLNVSLEKQEVSMQITGNYNLENAMAAAALGQFFGLNIKQISTALSAYIPTNNRSQVKVTETNTVICDFYNANPSSMRAALANLKAQADENKAAILGDMFELGEESLDQHQSIINAAMEAGLQNIIFVGKSFYSLRNEQARFYKDAQKAYKALEEKPVQNAFILLKGSRGMALEQLLPIL